MAEVEIYTKDHCPFCARAKALLDGKDVAYRELDVTHDRAGFEEMVSRAGRRTAPQIFIDGRSVGGSDDLAALERRGELERLLTARAA